MGEEREMQYLQMERKKLLRVPKGSPNDGVLGMVEEEMNDPHKAAGLMSPKGARRKRISFSKMDLALDSETMDNSPPSPKGKSSMSLKEPTSPLSSSTKPGPPKFT